MIMYQWKTYKLFTSPATFQVFPAEGAIVEISKPAHRTILNLLLNSIKFRIRGWLVMSVRCFE